MQNIAVHHWHRRRQHDALVEDIDVAMPRKTSQTQANKKSRRLVR